MNDLAQMKFCKLVCVLLTSRDIKIAICQLYRASEIVIRLQGQLNIEAGLVNQTDNPTLKRQLTSNVSTIFALKIIQSVRLPSVSDK